MCLETVPLFPYSKIMESFALALIDNIKNDALKIYLILFVAVVSLFIYLIKNKSLTLFLNICQLVIGLCALTLLFSEIIDLREQWYAVFFQGVILKVYFITICSFSVFLILLVAIPNCYLLISSKQVPLIRWKMLKTFHLIFLRRIKKYILNAYCICAYIAWSFCKSSFL